MSGLKVTYQFREGALRLRAVDRTGHHPPTSDPIAPGAGGFWLTVHDQASAQVHAQILPDPHTGTAGHLPGGLTDQARTVVVPDPGPNGFLVFHTPFNAPGGALISPFPLKRSADFLDLLFRLLRGFRKKKRPVWLLILSVGFGPAEMAAFDAFADRFVQMLSALPPFGDFPELSPLIARRNGPAANHMGLTWTRTPLAGRDLITVDYLQAADVVGRLDVDPLNVLVVVNEPIYGGSGGDPAVTGIGFPGLADDAVDAAIHELGHSAFALADEYAIAGNDAASNEPVELNVASDQAGVQAKWGALLTPGLGLPSHPAAAGAQAVVGMFEGAKWKPTGTYRAQLDCRMRSVDKPFCAACRTAISAVLVCELASLGA